MFTRWTILIFIIFLFTTGPVSNFAYADFDKGLKAYYYEEFETALTEWLIDAKQGNMLAQYRIGFMYANGEGVAENKEEALKWYRLAAEQGYDYAQYWLADMYYDGEGIIPQDFAEAARWYRLAADQGEGIAQLRLGNMYANGEGVPENDIAAYMWFNLAAAQGYRTASRKKNELKERMTQEQIAEAHWLYFEWLEEHQ